MSRLAVITGARGLIGSALARALTLRGWEVAGLDDGSTSTVPWAVVPTDRSWSMSVEQAVAMHPKLCEHAAVLVHCASPVGPTGILHGGSVLDRMLASTRAALQLSEASRCPVVLFSSSEVHGRMRAARTFAVEQGWSPRNEYQVGKIAVELAAGRHRHETGLPTMLVRPWNIAGPLQDPAKGFVFPRFAEAARSGGELTVYGTGGMRRAFMDVNDAAQVLADAIEAGAPGPGVWDATPLELANPDNETTIYQLAERFLAHPLARPGARIVHADPVQLHGPLFREASSGSKLPPADVPLRGAITLDAMVDTAMNVAAARAMLTP